MIVFHDTELAIQRMRDFYDNKLYEYYPNFQPNQACILPFPSITPHDRIPVNERNEFTFFGRENMTQLRDWIISSEVRKRRVIRGNVGGGKSMKIAATVVELMRPRYLEDSEGHRYKINPHFHRVVYIPDCKDISESLEESLLSAVRLAFPESTFKQDFLNAFSQEKDYQRAFLRSFLSQQAVLVDSKIIFIYDGFNHFEPFTIDKMSQALGNIAAEQRTFLLNIASYGACIIALSSQNETSFKEDAKDFRIDGGLTDTEWNGWKTREPFTVLGGFDQDILKDYTGLIPILLSKLAGLNGTIEERFSLYERDPDVKSFGGQAVRNEIQNFTDNIFEKWNKESNKRKTHVEMMKNALVGRPNGVGYASELMDHRYFYFRDGVIYPICGFVKRIISNYIPSKEA